MDHLGWEGGRHSPPDCSASCLQSGEVVSNVLLKLRLAVFRDFPGLSVDLPTVKPNATLAFVLSGLVLG
jgi:hypothetical protein